MQQFNVLARLRPLLAVERSNTSGSSVNIIDGQPAVLGDRFDVPLLDEATSQYDIYNHDSIHRLAKLSRRGLPAALLACGSSSSGKTHSLFRIGDGWPFTATHQNENGVVARLADDLLGAGLARSDEGSVRLAFLEVKGNRVTDLLSGVAPLECDG